MKLDIKKDVSIDDIVALIREDYEKFRFSTEGEFSVEDLPRRVVAELEEFIYDDQFAEALEDKARIRPGIFEKIRRYYKIQVAKNYDFKTIRENVTNFVLSAIVQCDDPKWDKYAEEDLVVLEASTIAGVGKKLIPAQKLLLSDKQKDAETKRYNFSDSEKVPLFIAAIINLHKLRLFESKMSYNKRFRKLYGRIQEIKNPVNSRERDITKWPAIVTLLSGAVSIVFLFMLFSVPEVARGWTMIVVMIAGSCCAGGMLALIVTGYERRYFHKREDKLLRRLSEIVAEKKDAS